MKFDPYQAAFEELVDEPELEPTLPDVPMLEEPKLMQKAAFQIGSTLYEAAIMNGKLCFVKQ